MGELTKTRIELTTLAMSKQLSNAYEKFAKIIVFVIALIVLSIIALIVS